METLICCTEKCRYQNNGYCTYDTTMTSNEYIQSVNSNSCLYFSAKDPPASESPDGMAHMRG